jgi:predicted TIM-barrel fold metal-dependent hydrolase
MAVIPLAKIIQRILDPHVHFFDISKGEYAWLKIDKPPFWPDKQLINKTFTPESLITDLDFSLYGVVHIEAGFDNAKPCKEVDYLESDVYPSRPNLRFKTIAFIDLLLPEKSFKKQVLKLKKYKSVVGVRYIFDDYGALIEEDKVISANKSTIYKNLKCLERAELIFELQADFSHQKLINYLYNLVVLLPRLQIVINHAGLPEFTHSVNYAVWESALSSFAKMPYCFVKCSGFEMISRTYTHEEVRDVLFRVASLFGAHKMMLASNFPLTLFSTSYAEYWKMLLNCAQSLELPLNAICYTNAKKLYAMHD